MKVKAKAKHIPRYLLDLGGGQGVRWGNAPEGGGLYWVVGAFGATSEGMVMLMSLENGQARTLPKGDTVYQHGITLANLTAVEDYDEADK